MHRISTDIEYLQSGEIIIDADGIPVDVPDRTHMEAADEALGQRIDNEKWSQGRITPATLTSVDNAPEGFVQILNPADATTYGLPFAAGGLLETRLLGDRGYQLFHVSVESKYTLFGRLQGGSGVWSSWSQVAPVEKELLWSQGGRNPTTLPSLDDAPEGYIGVYTPSNAEAWGLPLAEPGTLETRRIGSYRQQIFTGLSGKTATRRSTSGVWSEWAITGEDTAPTQATSAPAQTSGFKVVPLALTLGSSGTVRTAQSGGIRIPLNFNAPITRWRIGITNRNTISDVVGGTNTTISQMTFGAHDGNGAFTATPRVIMSPTRVNGDGSTTYSPWQYGGIGEGMQGLIAFDWEAPDAATAPLRNVCGGWHVATGTTTTLAPATAVTLWGPYDIWVEAETLSTTPVIAVVGDSLACGAQATLPVHDSWLSQYCRDQKALPIHRAYAGGQGRRWYPDAGLYRVNRWTDLARPDAVIWAFGTNDIAAGSTLDELKATVLNSFDLIKRIYSENVFATTIIPRSNFYTDAAKEQMRTDYNTWITWRRNEARDVFDFATAVDDGTGKLNPVYDADTIHLKTGGYRALADSITRPVTPPPAMHQPTDPGWSNGVFDTGLRNINALVDPTYSTGGSGSARLQRTNNFVSLDIHVLRNDVAEIPPYTTFMTLPVGFRPSTVYRQLSSSPSGIVLEVKTNGDISTFNTPIPKDTALSTPIRHITRDATPTTFPGSPA